jgi:hypothetical protein
MALSSHSSVSPFMPPPPRLKRPAAQLDSAPTPQAKRQTISALPVVTGERPKSPPPWSEEYLKIYPERACSPTIIVSRTQSRCMPDPEPLQRSQSSATTIASPPRPSNQVLSHEALKIHTFQTMPTPQSPLPPSIVIRTASTGTLPDSDSEHEPLSSQEHGALPTRSTSNASTVINSLTS